MNLASDYLLIDDPITVSYLVKTAEGVWASGFSVPYVQRQALTYADYEMNPALLQKVAAVFQLWKANLAGVVPKIGDKHSDGVNWIIERVELLDRDANGVQRYRLTCQKSTA